MLPTQTDTFLPVLEYFATVDTATRKDAKEAIADRFQLTDEEREERIPSGMRTYESRVGWAVSYISTAGFIERVSRGVYRITERGRAKLKENPTAHDFALEAFALGRMGSDANAPESVAESAQIGSPQEEMEKNFDLLNSQLGDDLLKAIMDCDPKFFEKLVIDLLAKMGYGQGRVTQYSNDGGIDGIVSTDPLGFDPICTQAKRYDPAASIGRKEIQAFAGALGSVKRGAFVTTATFTANAKDYARTYPHADIVLIDGKKLTQLMIGFGLGVSVDKEYVVKKVDYDYFEEE